MTRTQGERTSATKKDDETHWLSFSAPEKAALLVAREEDHFVLHEPLCAQTSGRAGKGPQSEAGSGLRHRWSPPVCFFCFYTCFTDVVELFEEPRIGELRASVERTSEGLSTVDL